MKHTGIARRAAFKIIVASLATTIVPCGIAVAFLRFLEPQSHFVYMLCIVVTAVLGTIWLLFALFTIYFFRDPEPNPPSGPGLVVSPGHGKVDAIEQITEPQFMGGACHRVSIFLSVIDVHVQNAPVSGEDRPVSSTPPASSSTPSRPNRPCTMKTCCSVLPPPKRRARKSACGSSPASWPGASCPLCRWAMKSARGDRISLIQFGSRCDLYLPLALQNQGQTG